MAAAPARTVAVFGSYDSQPGGEGYPRARSVGRRLAELGYALANGGYGGSMEAAARGAVEAGGHTIGVTCSLWRSHPNVFIRQVVETKDLAERIERLAELGGAGCVVLPGGTGTLLELAWVWERVAKGIAPARPIVCVGEFWRPVIDLMAGARAGSAEAVSVIAGPEDLTRHFPPVLGRGGGLE